MHLALLVILVLAASGTAWYWFELRPGAPVSKKERTGAPAVPVVVATASVLDVPVYLDVTGRTEAYETVTLRSRVDGQVKSVTFADGQHVRQGDVLLQLDPADFQARLAQAQANQAKSNAQLQKARADLERAIALRAKGFVSEEKVNETRTAVATADAAANADTAAAELARLQLSYTTIRSPINGSVGAKLVFPGAAVRASDTALAVVNRIRPLHVAFSVPEKYLPALQTALRDSNKKMLATITVPGGSEGLEGQVRFIDNGVDAATGTIVLKALVANDQEKLASGQFVTVSLVLERLKGAVVVPAEALQQNSEGAFVFVVKSDDTVEVRKVRVGNVQKAQAVIAEGLAAGDTVVIEGQLRLTGGARVTRVDLSKKPG
ncbi:MAG: efflux RND transporter periplasmic adaptor subunit [Rhodocyclaceae bacterium]|nr:efflux RND transporter periplasmic adaptor subunit [Rhodocyclaceae bacterium]